VRSIAFSADSKTLVAGGKAYDLFKDRGGASIAMRSVSGKDNIRALPDNDKDHVALAASPDDKLLATAGSDHKVRLYDFDGELQKTLTGHTADVRVVTFAPRGGLLATGDDGKIILWDVKTGKKITSLASKGAALKILQFADGGRKLLSVDQQGVVKV